MKRNPIKKPGVFQIRVGITHQIGERFALESQKSEVRRNPTPNLQDFRFIIQFRRCFFGKPQVPASFRCILENLTLIIRLMGECSQHNSTETWIFPAWWRWVVFFLLKLFHLSGWSFGLMRSKKPSNQHSHGKSPSFLVITYKMVDFSIAMLVHQSVSHF